MLKSAKYSVGRVLGLAEYLVSAGLGIVLYLLADLLGRQYGQTHGVFAGAVLFYLIDQHLHLALEHSDLLLRVGKLGGHFFLIVLHSGHVVTAEHRFFKGFFPEYPEESCWKVLHSF